jgi:hypothetical protein
MRLCGGGGGLDCWREDKHAAKIAITHSTKFRCGVVVVGLHVRCTFVRTNGDAAKTPEFAPLAPLALLCAPDLAWPEEPSFAPVCHPQHNIVPCLATTQHF